MDSMAGKAAPSEERSVRLRNIQFRSKGRIVESSVSDMPTVAANQRSMDCSRHEQTDVRLRNYRPASVGSSCIKISRF